MGKIRCLLLMMMLCGNILADTDVKSSAPADLPAEINSILSGKATVPEIRGEKIEGLLRSNIRKTGDWLRREKSNLKNFGICSAVTVLAGVLLSMGIRHLTRFRNDCKYSLRRRLLVSLATPFIYFVMTAAIFIFMLPLLHSLPSLYPWDARIFFTLQTIIVAWGGFELIMVFDGRLHAFAKRPDNNLDELMVDIIRKSLKVILTGVTLLFIGQNIFDLNITTLLAGAGVFGIAVAFASRETLANFFGTLVIILDRPFRCGDRIQVAGIDGIVESVGMRSTRIITGKESYFSVPNSTIASSNVENISVRGLIRYALTLALTYDTPAEKMEEAMQILHDIADDFHGKDQEKYRPRVFFHSFGESALELCMIMWLKTGDYETEERLHTELNMAILRRFNAAEISFAFNTTTNIVQGTLCISDKSS